MLQPALLPMANVTFDMLGIRTLSRCQLCFGGRTIRRVRKDRSESQQVVDRGKEAFWNLYQLLAVGGAKARKGKYLIARLILACAL